LAEGSVANALSVRVGADAGTRAAKRFLAALRRGPEAWVGEALLQPPWGARGDFSAMLDALAVQLRNELRNVADGDKPFVSNHIRALKLVEEHRASTQRNVNPQLSMAVLASSLGDTI
jgi:hypothetical protein